MEFSGLVSSVWESGMPRQNLLIIIPVYTEYPVLFEHLRYLSGQKYRKFDAIIILGNVADEKKVIAHVRKGKFRFRVIVAKRKEDTGPAGAFFAGQKYALENGYGYVVFAESDCFPVSRDVVGQLYSRRHQHCAGARVEHFDSGRRKVSSQGNINHYSLLSREIMLQKGLYFAPLYLGAEDLEYQERLGLPRAMIRAACSHPIDGRNIHRKIERHVLYIFNSLVANTKNPLRMLYLLVKLAIPAVVFPIFMRREYSGYFTAITSAFISFRFGKPLYGALSADYSKMGRETGRPLTELSFEAVMPPMRYLPGALATAASFFRRDVCVRRAYEFTPVFLLCAFARKLYVGAEGRTCLLLADNSGQAAHLLKLVLFAAVLPLFLLFLVIAFVPLKLLRQPITMRYGLD